MSYIEDALARKRQQLPQFDYMWRVELPELGQEGFMDPHGVVARNTPPEVSEFITGGFGGGAYGVISRGVERLSNIASDYTSGLVSRFLPSVGKNFSKISSSIVLKTEKQTDMLNHRVFSIEAPYRNFDVGKFMFGQKHFYTATTSDIGALNMRIDEYEDGGTLDYLLQWQKLIRNDDGTNNPPATYKRDISLIKMSNSGLDLHVSVFRGCFPSEVGQSSYNYDSNAITQYNVNFVCDDVVHFMMPASDVIRAVEQSQPDIMNGSTPEEQGLLSALKKNSIVKNLTAGVLAEVNRRIGSYFF